MTFAEIERLVGALPASADRPQWWANVRDAQTSHAQREAWRVAGYDAFLIAGARKVRFVRIGTGAGREAPRAVAPTAAAKPALTAEALLAGGFEVASRWVLSTDGKLALDRPLPHDPGVYVFILKGVAVYAGIASSGLARRLAFYIRPGVTQRTSQRVGARLAEELRTIDAIDILTASPPAAVWNGWPIDAAAGLEVGLISAYDLSWNLRGV